MNLVFVEVGYPVNDDPGQGAAKVDYFVHDEGHDAGGKNIVLHEGVPGEPEALMVEVCSRQRA